MKRLSRAVVRTSAFAELLTCEPADMLPLAQRYLLQLAGRIDATVTAGA
jgi:hypothetical protein